MTPDPNTPQKGVQLETAPRLNPVLTLEQAHAELEQLHRWFGPEASFIFIHYGKKEPVTTFKDLTSKAAHSAFYQEGLLEAIQVGGNIALLFGEISGDIRCIDFDDPEQLGRFLIQNSFLARTVQRTSRRGGQIFFKIRSDAGLPDGKVISLHLEHNKGKGEHIGELRLGPNVYSVVYGWLDPEESGQPRDGEGVRYELFGEELVTLEHWDQINWPHDFWLPWNEKSAAAPPPGSPAKGPRPHDPDDDADPDPDDQANQAAVGGAPEPIKLDELAPDAKARLEIRIKAYLDRVDIAVQGKVGNCPTFRVACILTHEFCLCSEDAMRFMRYYSSTRCQPPWSEGEMERMVESALRKLAQGKNFKPFGNLLGWEPDQANQGRGGAATGPHQNSTPPPPQGEAAAPKADQGRAARFKVWVDKRPEELSVEFPPVLIPGWLYQGRRLMVTGKPNVGKGLFLLQLGFCLASGTPFLGKKLGEPRGVYHIDFELMEAAIRDRLWKMCEHFSGGKEAERDRLWTLVNHNMTILATLEHPELCDEGDFFEEITARARWKHQPEAALITFDPLWRICPSELDEKLLRKFLRDLNIFTRRSRASVAYAQHQTKGDQFKKDVIDRFSGKNDLARDCATMLTLGEIGDGGHVDLDGRTNDFPQPERTQLLLKYPVFELNYEEVKAGNKNREISAEDARKFYRATDGEGGWVLQADLVRNMIKAGFSRATAYRATHQVKGYLRFSFVYDKRKGATTMKWTGFDPNLQSHPSSPK